MREARSNVIHVRFRKPEPKRPKRQGLALSFGATADGRVLIAASGRRRYTVSEVNALIRELRDVRDDAKAKARAR